MKISKIDQIRKMHDDALKIDEKELASDIRNIGFQCQRCAKCCQAGYGDNTVLIFPFEIRKISEKTGLVRDDIAIPTPSSDMDSEGNFHTFEWVLNRKNDCVFLKCGSCEIYDSRPFICKTYPFYLHDRRLLVSECEGLGGKITIEESIKIAISLKERYITELNEMISLFSKFRGFNPSGNGICVHDSEGEHWIRPK